MRDSYVDGDVRTIVTTDRLSAFDRLLGTIPFKGQVLNEIANYWFDATSDIVANHLLEVPDPNVVRVRECAPVPLEFVVRAYITGVTKTSLWSSYEAGARNIAGNLMPDGLRKNERLEAPILTPTTKFEAHDRNLGRDDAIAEGLVTADLFDRCADVCFRLFARGTELAARRGLILADTKYELGLLGDEIVLIDEVHTPDSSRYWYADTYDELFRKDKDQRALDKEPLREWMAERGFRGDGQAPVHDRRGPHRDRNPLHPPRRGTDPATVRGPGAHRSRTGRQPPPRLTARVCRGASLRRPPPWPSPFPHMSVGTSPRPSSGGPA